MFKSPNEVCAASRSDILATDRGLNRLVDDVDADRDADPDLFALQKRTDDVRSHKIIGCDNLQAVRVDRDRFADQSFCRDVDIRCGDRCGKPEARCSHARLYDRQIVESGRRIDVDRGIGTHGRSIIDLCNHTVIR